jgi:16S rRNA (cytidine1402-2'-O)-methyltransferase
VIFEIKHLAAGLHFVATPIGNARDITLRALDTLASADVLAAEDTRSLRRLMDMHGVPLGSRPMIAYHDHNGAKARPKLLSLMAQGKSVAYASEAGTPLVADPGFVLCREALEQDLFVTSAPGPSAMIAALTIAGLPSDRFLFVGFAPAALGARKKFYTEFGVVQATMGVYESPKRIYRTLTELCELYGADRKVAICRELTKRFEEVISGTLGELVESLKDHTFKGEIVLLIAREEPVDASEEDLEAALDEALAEMSVKDAAAQVSTRFNMPKRQVYQLALERARAIKTDDD